jgi:hypothetical protein
LAGEGARGFCALDGAYAKLSAELVRGDATKWFNARCSPTIWRNHMIVNKEDARAGKTGMGVRYVLGASLALAIVAMLAVYLGYL